MFQSILISIYCLAGCFWLVQMIDLLFRDPIYFESHTHKLCWFLVLCVGNIVAAVWYFFWKKDAVKKLYEKEKNYKATFINNEKE